MMGFLKDEGQRKYCIALAALLIVASVFAAIIWMENGNRVKETVLYHDRCVVSSLMNQGVSEAVIAKAFAEEEVTKEGTNLLNLMGIGEETEAFLCRGYQGYRRERA